MKPNKYPDERLKYVIYKNYIFFVCDAVDGDEECKNITAADLINGLLIELSKEHSVFYAADRLTKNADVSMLLDTDVIIARATELFNPFYTCIHLSEAKIDITNNDCCTVYFFEKDVEWADFLVSFEIGDLNLRKLIKRRKLCAYFEIRDGSEYLFKCSRVYEKRLRQFFGDMANAGYEVSKGRVLYR